jgi:hypothetical protein
VQPVELFRLEGLRQGERRQPRGVQDLIGIGVADPAQNVGVRERALERVVLAAQRVAKRAGGGGEGLEPARVQRRERGFTAHEMQRRAARGARFGEDQGAAREVEGRESHPARDRSPRGLPSQTPGDHQMQHQEQVGVESEHDAFAQAAQVGDGAARRRRHGWLHAADQKRVGDADGVQALAADPRAKGPEVELDVG